MVKKLRKERKELGTIGRILIGILFAFRLDMFELTIIILAS